MEVVYRSGPLARRPDSARLHLTTPRGEPLLPQVETLPGVPLRMSSDYVGDPAQSRVRRKGRDWNDSVTYNMSAPFVVAVLPFNALDHVAPMTGDDEVDWCLFERELGRHGASEFAGWDDLTH